MDEARAKFHRILELNPGNPKAFEAIQQINKAENDKKAKEEEEEMMLELSEGEEEKGYKGRRNGYGRTRRNDTMTEEEAKRNREKLIEMEEFIRKLKNSKK